MLALPVLGPIDMLLWLGEKVVQAEERELYDEDRLRGELLELQARCDLGEVTEEEYAQQEAALLERMNTIREAKSEGMPR